ncbi:MAG: hypothetical protein VKK98_05715, partial [Cyanobacteriota bacterium]|nr:hypothetical protein [Cyanobacteriota bacterium]
MDRSVIRRLALAGLIGWVSSQSPVQALDWKLVSEDEVIGVYDSFEAPPPLPPLNQPATALVMHQSEPIPADFLAPLNLGPAVPTANQLPNQDLQLSTFQLAAFSPSSGQQNYAVRLDTSLSERFQLSAFYSEANGALLAPISGINGPPGNVWESYGAAVQWRLAADSTALFPGSAGKRWNLAFTGSLESWAVTSGSPPPATQHNLVGSLALPFSWNITPSWQFSLSPGASFLPATQQTGLGSDAFYGSNVWLAGGVLWRAWPGLQLFGSALLPFGPGSNSFDSNLEFSRVPIFSGGLQWALNPRIAFRGMLTNGWGATPATALLALPSWNRLGYSASFVYTAGGIDTPQPALTARQWSLASGGLSVNTALVPPSGTVQLGVDADSGGNLFGQAAYSLSNIFQLDLLQAGTFNNLRPSDSYLSSTSWQWRLGGKAVVLSPLRGAPFWGGGRLTLGSGSTPEADQSYTLAETMATWEANPWLAFNVSPKLAILESSTPWGVGLSANVQLGLRFQLIPEVNLVASDVSETNATLALRWLAFRRGDHQSGTVDFYVSSAAGLLDLGQFLRSSDVRVGSRV